MVPPQKNIFLLLYCIIFDNKFLLILRNSKLLSINFLCVTLSHMSIFAGLILPAFFFAFIFSDGIDYNVNMNIPGTVMTIRMHRQNCLMSRQKFLHIFFAKIHCLPHGNIVFRRKTNDIMMDFYILCSIVFAIIPIDLNTFCTEGINLAIDTLDIRNCHALSFVPWYPPGVSWYAHQICR